jgi:hypothetical protein
LVRFGRAPVWQGLGAEVCSERFWNKGLKHSMLWILTRNGN